MERKILIIDGKSSIKSHFEDFLSSRFEVECVSMEKNVVSFIAKFKPKVILMDIVFQAVDGIAILEEICRNYPPSRIIVITEFVDMKTVIKAYRLGISDFFRKNVNVKKLQDKINKVLKWQDSKNDFLDLSNNSLATGHEAVLVGQSEAMCRVFKMIASICNSRATVAIGGETGTGKELVARIIHENSPYKNEPFVTVDCTTIVETLAESTLYGHERGAFTGAIETRKGKLEIAGNGTIFFDEIGELPLSIQGKLLRFLQEREYERVGGKGKQKSNARIIAATNKDLSKLMKQGKFRRDLYYRLKVLVIYLPPLRERKEDIPLLIEHFARKIKRLYALPTIRIEGKALRLLQEYSWPGNVRELENVLTRAAIVSRGQPVFEETIMKILERSQEVDFVDKEKALPAYSSLADIEKHAIHNTLKYTRWNISETARILKISRTTLRGKIRKYQLRP